MSTRRLAAILAADVVGYSRLVSANEADALKQLSALRHEIIEPNIAKHSGRLFKVMGDGFLAEFASAVQAVTCAIAIQDRAESDASTLEDAKKMRLRIGVHVGDVLVEGDDLMGDGVNIAARLEGVAASGGISISRAVHEQVRDRIDAAFDDNGEVALKNIARPVQVFALAATRPSLLKAPPASPLALPDKPSIAVLPFQNMSGDPEQEYFADGIVEDIITALSRVKWFFVIARNSSFTYKGRAVDVRQVGRELGVRYVLEGSIRKSGNRVRITGQLIEAATGNHVWADRFEGSLEDVFELQDKITETVVGAIEPSLTMAEIRRSSFKPTNSLDAYDLYLRALLCHYTRTRESLDEAIRLLDKAITIDPDYALAKAFAAFIHALKFSQSLAAADDIAKGGRLAHEALGSSRDEPTTIAMAAHALALLTRDYDTALDAMDRAIYLNPNSAQVVGRSAWLRAYVSDADRAIDEFLRAMRLSPVDPDINFNFAGLAFALLIKGDYEKALDYARRSAREMPHWIPAWRAVVVASVKTDRLQEAREAVRHILLLSPNYSIAQARRAFPYRNECFCEMHADALRKAGLPE